MVPQTIPLGLPHPYGGGRGAPGGGDCIAFRWPVTREVADALHAYEHVGHRRVAGGNSVRSAPASRELTH
jgi:hypothetical protein